jgi:hypothetical protein
MIQVLEALRSRVGTTDSLAVIKALEAMSSIE